MKKFFICSLAFLISACTHGSIYSQFDQDCHSTKAPCTTCHEEKTTYSRPAQPNTAKARPITMVAQEPTYQYREPAPIIVEKPVVRNTRPTIVERPIITQTQNTNCNGCQPVIRQTREPVEIIYKKVTYTTVYEPKTTSTVTYEREAVSDKKIIYQPQTAQKKKIIIKTTNNQPNLSEVIESTLSSEPAVISVEEIK